MSLEDRTRWEQRHERELTLAPRASVLGLAGAPSPDALALDVACGQGRHSRALRSAGWQVVSIDVSLAALRRLRSAADPGIAPVQGDVDDWPFAAASFDLIVQVDFLDRALFPQLRDSLRPGGLLLVDTFLDQGRRNEEGPSQPDYLLAPGELPRVFADLSVLRYDEVRAATARAVFLARKRIRHSR